MSALPKTRVPPLPANDNHRRQPPGTISKFPTGPFQKRVLKRVLKRMLPTPFRIVWEAVDFFWPSPMQVVTPAGWQVHCQRTTSCPNTPGIRPCAQTWGPGCTGTGACTCANVGQSFPGSVYSPSRRQTWIYELSPLSVCNRMIYHSYMTSCAATSVQTPHRALPRPQEPRARVQPLNDIGGKAGARMPEPFKPFNPTPWQAPDPMVMPDPLPEVLPQFVPPLQPLDSPNPVPYPSIPNLPDYLPLAPGEQSVRGPGYRPWIDLPGQAPWNDPGVIGVPRSRPRPDQLPRNWPNVRPRPSPTPATDPAPGPSPFQPAPWPKQILRPQSFRAPGVEVRLEPNGQPQANPQPAGKGEKNPKYVLAIAAGSGIGRAVNIATEGFDLVECLHKALPKRLQSKPKFHKGKDGQWERNRGISLKTKMKDLYHSIDSKLTPLEAGKALGNALQHCIDNALEDKQFGMMGKQLAKASRHKGSMHGYQIGGSARQSATRLDLVTIP